MTTGCSSTFDSLVRERIKDLHNYGVGESRRELDPTDYFYMKEVYNESFLVFIRIKNEYHYMPVDMVISSSKHDTT